MAATTAGVLPVFLAGALTVQISRQLHFGGSGLGLVVAVFFVGATAGSLLAGRIAERIGVSRAMRFGVVGSALCLAGIAVAANSLLVLGAFLVVAGFTDGVIQPAVNGFLADRVASGRQGLAFGVKQSAVPVSTLLGGLAVPAIALTVGWRWAFVASAAVALLTAAVLPSPRRTLAVADARSPHPATSPAVRGRPERSGAPDSHGILLRPLVVLAAAAGIGAGSANALGTFLVSSAVAAHVAEGTAGALAAAGSVCGLVARVTVSWRADRHPGGDFRVVATMLALGAAGYGLLASQTPTLMVLGALLAFGAGWGWNGLFNYAVVRSHPRSPARATGITQAGIFIGAVVIPPVFGVLVDRVSYTVAWLLAAVLVLVSAAVMLAGGRRLQAAIADPPPGDAAPPTAADGPGRHADAERSASGEGGEGPPDALGADGSGCPERLGEGGDA